MKGNLKGQEKNFILFGEEHHRQHACDLPYVSADVFLFDFCKRAYQRGHVVDIFIEGKFHLINTPKSEWYLSRSMPSQIIRKFGCSQGKCDIEGVRMHYTDVRNVEKYELFLFIFSNHSDLSRYANDVDTNNLSRDLFKKFDIEYRDVDGNINFDKFYTETKLNKQLSLSIFGDELRVILKNMNREFESATNIIQDLLFKGMDSRYYVQNFMPGDNARIQHNIGDMIRSYHYKPIFEYFSQLLDVYSVARMTRSFRDIQGRYSEPPRNIIFYGGANHTKNIVSILSGLGYTRIFKHEDQDKMRCLKFEKSYELF